MPNYKIWAISTFWYIIYVIRLLIREVMCNLRFHRTKLEVNASR